MESWITRIVATLCAMGSTGLFWTFGVFVTVPWQDGRMLSLDHNEMQVIGVSLIVGIAVAWGALHIFALADRQSNPRSYAIVRAMLILISLAAVVGGSFWAQARVG
jgi:hypothetical protein